MKINDWKEFGTFSNKASIPEPPKGTEQKIREEWGVFVAYRRPVDKDAWEYDGFFCYRADGKKAAEKSLKEMNKKDNAFIYAMIEDYSKVYPFTIYKKAR